MQASTGKTKLATRARAIWIMTSTLVLLVFFCSASYAKTLNLVVQPILSPKRSISFYKPLADYLSKQTGVDIKIVAAVNFPAYWETMKKNTEYDIIMDAAHFTDFRSKRLNYTVLAKVPDTVSYSLVTAEESLILDPEELIGKRIATMSSPGLGGIRLAEMFPNPLRQPILLETSSSLKAAELVKTGEAVAAIIPTPLLNTISGLNTVVTTDPVPHVGVSVSPRVSEKTRQSIKTALITAINTKDGKAMLKAISFPKFVTGNAELYSGNAELLDGVWGY